MVSDPARAPSVYRTFTQDALDAQYNFRAHVPEHPAFFDRWGADSVSARAALAGHLDIAYGAHPRQRLDVFPAVQQPAPVLLFLHGGYWQALSKDWFRWLASPWTAANTTMALASYGLCPDVSLNDILRHVTEAVVWLHRHGAEIGVMPTRLVVAGHSAGGQLAALLAGMDWTVHGLARPAVAGAVCISGLYDLEPIRLSYLNRTLHLTQEAAYHLSPLHWAADRPPSACVLAAGAWETQEVHRQQTDYAAALRRAGTPVTALTVPATHHFSVLDELATPDRALFGTAATLLHGTG